MIFRSRTIWVFLFFISVFIIGFITGRITCRRFTPLEPIILTTQEPPSQGGEGILTPVEPSQSYPGEGESPQPPFTISHPQPSISTVPSWFKFTDANLNISVHATQADSINYTFNKRWYPFTPTSPYITKISVYGVAPESIDVQLSEPPQRRKKFSTIITLTTPNPTWNLIFSYKKIAFHLQTPHKVDTKNLSYGLGYHWQF